MGLIQITDVTDHKAYRSFDAVQTKGELVRVGKVLFDQGARIPPEGFAIHEEDEYICVLSGTITFGTEAEEYALQVGDFHHMPKETKHWCQSTAPGTGELLYVLVK